jgi:exopolyphosphatase/guanosine-5'-triphosphate,3'-diphosphate pyrophosphatase
MLALTAMQVEPNLRARQAYSWAMDKRWISLDPRGRACIAAALLAAVGKNAPPPELERLANRESLHEAATWGLAFRLCRRLGAGSRASLMASDLRREGDALILRLDPSRAQLLSDQVNGDLKALAQWLGLEPEVRIGDRVTAM